MNDALLNLPLEARMLDGSAGQLFTLWFPPQKEPRGALLCVPPFAEENNRSRVMMTRAARLLAAEGFGILILDLYGTGDSAGEFEQATWEQWLCDLSTGYRWLDQQGYGQPFLWGIRLSALLVCHWLEKKEEKIGGVMFWQPVVKGKTYMTQYLRLRVAEAANRGEKLTTEQLRGLAAGGEIVESGGYRLHPDMIRAVDEAELTAAGRSENSVCIWLEQALNEAGEISPASRRCVDALAASGWKVRTKTFQGPPFWQMNERHLADELIRLTAAEVVHGW